MSGPTPLHTTGSPAAKLPPRAIDAIQAEIDVLEQRLGEVREEMSLAQWLREYEEAQG